SPSPRKYLATRSLRRGATGRRNGASSSAACISLISERSDIRIPDARFAPSAAASNRSSLLAYYLVRSQTKGGTRMSSRTVTAMLDAPKEQVFDYLSQIVNLPKWASEFARE